MISLLLALALSSAPALAEPDPGALAAWHQEQRPELERRVRAAQAREAAALAWFAGQGTLDEAFPQLAHAPLTDPAFLAGLAAQLDARDAARAAERVAPPPAGLPPREAEALVRARDAACEAEEQADAALRRLVAAARASLAAAPALAAPETAALRATWARVREDARARLAEDPAAAALAAAAGEAEAALSRLERAAVQSFAVPGDQALHALARADLDSGLADGSSGAAEALREEARLDRLRRALPLLPEALAQEVRALDGARQQAALAREVEALRAELAQREATPAAPAQTVEIEQTAVVAADRAVAEARDALKALPEDAGLAQERARLQLALAELRLTRARERLEAAEASLVESRGSTSAEDVEDLAAAASERAARAREAVEADDDPRAVAVSAVREAMAKVNERSAELLHEESRRRAEATARLADRHADLEAALAASAAARAEPPGPGSPRERLLFEAWEQLHALVARLRADLVDWTDTTDALSAGREHAMAGLGEGLDLSLADPALARAWREAEAGMVAALDTRQANLLEETARVQSWLALARGERRRLEASLDEPPAPTLSAAGLEDLASELRALGTRARFLLISGEGLLESPRRLLNISKLLTWLLGSVELLGLGLAWWWSRRQVGAWSFALLRQATRDEALLVPADLEALRRPLADLARDLLDVLAALALLLALPADLVLLRFLALVWLVREATELGPLVVRTALATPDERRPALRLVSPELRALLERSVYLLVLWWGASRVAEGLTLDLLDLDRSTALVVTLSHLVLGVLALALLRAWTPLLRLAVAFHGGEGRVAAWVRTEADSGLGELLRGLVATGLLLGRAAQALATRFTQEDRSLSWLGALMARRTLRADAEQPAPALPEADAEALRRALSRPPERPAAFAELDAAARAWVAEGRMGLIAVVGDWGAGKTDMLDALEARLPEGVSACRLRAPPLLNDAGAAVDWLRAAIGAGVAPDAEALVAHLGELPPTAFLVDDLHQVFLRSVGGYTALRAVLALMRATCDRHLWVTTYHAPTWAYLELLAPRMGLDAYRRVVRLAPLSTEELGAWLMERTEAAGRVPGFERLARSAGQGLSADLALQRGRAAYFRLLTEACAGNPHVAVAFWLASLSPGAEAGALEVHLFKAPPSAVLDGLHDHDRFVLTGLVIHDGLPPEALSDVLNLPAGRVRGVCARLQGLGVVDVDPVNGLNVVSTWRPAVVRHLRLKHFLRRGGA